MWNGRLLSESEYRQLLSSNAAWTLTGSSEFAVAGESFTLTCNPHDSNAVAVKWKRLDIDTTATGTSRATIEATGCKIGSGSDTQYQYTCEPGPVYKLTIPANEMTNSQNNKVWRCESTFGGGAAEYKVKVQDNSAAAEYKVKVQVPVSSISIQADNAFNQNVIIVYENTTKTFYCITNGCRPKANISVTTTGVTKGQSTESTTQNGDLIITRVSQVITANRGDIPSVEPTLTGYSNSTVLYEDDNDLTLTCQQSGGYPLSVITWSCESQTGTTNSGQTVANPPTTPKLQTSGTRFPWIENTTGVLRCTTTPGNPPETTYDWLQNSQVINGQTTDTYTIPTLTYVHNRLRIQCRVSNLYTIQRPPAKLSNITVLDVQYTPIITLDTTSIKEGDSPSRQCSAIGNPTPTVKWYRGSIEQTSGTETSATLVFSNIDRNQADTYHCKATATGKQNFESNGFPTNYTYHGWHQYIGSTIVRSYTDFTGMLSDSNRKIKISKVTFEDIGRYHCFVENGFHGRKPDVLQQGSSYFDVRVSAKFDPKEEVRKPGELHKNLTINITFYSNPPALMNDIKWINITSIRNPLTDSDSISINLTSTVIQRPVFGKVVTLIKQSAILTLAKLQSFHLGHYQLEIQNGGNLSSSFDFQIITSAPPEAPTEFSLAENGTKSVKVTWKRGFNGGHEQTFVIRYTNTDTKEMKETTKEDTSLNSNYTIEIDGLEPSTTYHFWIYSTNKKGNSTLSGNLIVQTLKGN
ncbi:LOW QUALITY PROTEIN: hypothetical protein KUTeg_002731 [Tegillarca granosa]|uniref:Uncharacterized protein n=1 Tax=Tegillarca granosa TaxID=220873 RepID=A0ABQ9FTX9_TEGGR|nr:LOW QUALITY PROTEIN: hypothetical protein KUTeg_002731 [Tegillarca granosa]